MHSEFYFSIVPRNTPSSRFGKTCREFFRNSLPNTSLCNFKQTIACCLDMTAVKFFGCLDQITGILYTGSLISRMHCELRKSDIHGIHGYLRHCNISQCTSTCRIRTVGKKLHRYTCLFTDCLENRNTYCITGIFLTGMRFGSRFLRSYSYSYLHLSSADNSGVLHVHYHSSA